MTHSSTFTEQEQRLMQRVLDLAAQGQATTQPNPRVGCVLVKDGQVVGEGFHQKAGEPHAEREALKQAGAQARGATAYVNLEPCCHQGRTPPCTDGLIDAGVVRVVAAVRDPNPLVAGGGFEVLEMAGIDVASGLLEDEARWLNRGFITRMQHARPWVTLKSAATLDGRTAAFDGQSKWITDDASRAQVQILRANSAAVITGIGTVLADDPSLNVRLEGAERQPLRVLLDSHLRLPLDAKIIGSGEDMLVFTCSDDDDKISALTELDVEVIVQAGNAAGQLNLPDVLKELARWQCNEVLLEAGQTLAGAFMAASLIDEVALFYGGSVLGSDGKAMFSSEQPMSFDLRPQFEIKTAQKLVNDVLVTAVDKHSLARLVA